mgnify:FL=1
MSELKTELTKCADVLQPYHESYSRYLRLDVCFKSQLERWSHEQVVAHSTRFTRIHAVIQIKLTTSS